MYTIGVDLGGTNIAVGLCDEELRIIKKLTGRTGAHRSSEEIVRDMAKLAEDVMTECSVSIDEIEYVGIATPGAANQDTGIVEYSCNLPFRDFPLAETFKKYLPVSKVYIANDANAAALAEALIGKAKNTKISVMITLGTGVGGGIIIDGKILTGGINFAGGELGHTVIRHGGRPCGCGRRGCFEAYSSASALTAITKEKMDELKASGTPSALFEIAEADGKVSARTAFKAARENDPYAKELVNDYIEHLATGVTNFVNIFQPDIITIGGGVSNEGDDLINPLRKIVDREQYTPASQIRTKVDIASLKNDAGIIGAAGLGR